MDRNKKILICLVIIFMITLAYRLNHPFKQATVAELTYSGEKNKRVITMKIPSAEDEDLKISHTRVMISDFLNPPSHSGAVIKNLFFDEKKTVPTNEKIPAEPLPMVEAEDTEPYVPDKMAIVDEELGRFTVLGSYESKGEKAIFLQRGKETLVIRVGDRIDGKYRVQEITGRSIRLLAETLNETVYIDMGEF
ncbi:MAG: hypothetical protein KJ737_15975 [Proteobacteria bacterium]|nr:hypothetical protein [Pseudomonadota bacterium]